MSDRVYPLPRDWGKELFRDGNWVLFRDYLSPKHGPRVGIGHMCHGEPWTIKMGVKNIVGSRCSACGEVVPEENIGLQKLVEWDR
jgi:hypothetical protein